MCDGVCPDLARGWLALGLVVVCGDGRARRGVCLGLGGVDHAATDGGSEMRRIVAHFAGGDFVNIEGDRIEHDSENNMIYAYCGKELVGAFEIDAVVKIYITDRKN